MSRKVWAVVGIAAYAALVIFAAYAASLAVFYSLGAYPQGFALGLQTVWVYETDAQLGASIATGLAVALGGLFGGAEVVGRLHTLESQRDAARESIRYWSMRAERAEIIARSFVESDDAR